MTDEERARAWLNKWVYNDDDGPNLDRPLEALLAAVRVEEREASTKDARIWEDLCVELRTRESQMSGILCDLRVVPSDPLDGLKVLAEAFRASQPERYAADRRTTVPRAVKP